VTGIDLKRESYVKEVLDAKGRTIKIELFSCGHHFRYAFVPPIIRFGYDDSTITETLYNVDGQPWQDSEGLDYNRMVYVLKSDQVVRKYKYFNGRLLNIVESDSSNDERLLVEYFYYAGCKGNSAYFLERISKNLPNSGAIQK
jgi:hypothetical protein